MEPGVLDQRAEGMKHRIADDPEYAGAIIDLVRAVQLLHLLCGDLSWRDRFVRTVRQHGPDLLVQYPARETEITHSQDDLLRHGGEFFLDPEQGDEIEHRMRSDRHLRNVAFRSDPRDPMENVRGNAREIMQ